MFTSYLVTLQQLAYRWLLTVINGCAGTLGISFSTKSVQSSLTVDETNVPASSPPSTLSFRQKRRRRKEIETENEVGDDNDAASYSRFSSPLQNEESNEDQQRMCQELSEGNGHRILPEFEYADEAVSGTKLHREGLDAMLQDAKRGEFKILYLYCLSRLARESVITLALVKDLVYNYGIRIICVTEQIDTNVDGWEMIVQIISMINEEYVKRLSTDVLRGQEGVVLNGYCVGDQRFGYSSEAIPGTERGRNKKPLKRYVIDPVEAPWVLRIFNWFVNGRQTITWIVKELNRRSAPKDHRSTTKDWLHQQVVNVLLSEKYIGIWPWGEMKNERDPLTGEITQSPRSEEECSKWIRNFQELRIIEDNLFYKAQELLEDNHETYAKNRSPNGQFKKLGNPHKCPRYLLSCLLKCEKCIHRINESSNQTGSPNFVVGTSSSGKFFFCQNRNKGICNCKTQLKMELANKMILDAIGERILGNPQWHHQVYKAMIAAWEERGKATPLELSAAKNALNEVQRKIDRLLDLIEQDNSDPDILKRCKKRKNERSELLRGIKKLERDSYMNGPEPTEEWLQEQLQNLGENINGDVPAAAFALRDLVGGEIVVREIRVEGRKRPHLQCQFSIEVSNVCKAISGIDIPDSIDGETQNADYHSETITIDFIPPDPRDAKSKEVKKLYDRGFINCEIAKELECSKAQVTQLLKYWHEVRNLEVPNNRKRRFQLDHESVRTPKYKQIADEVKRLYDEDMLLQEIAETLKVDVNTVTKALKYWHESRGLKVPDGRTRRKSLKRKVSKPRKPKKEIDPEQ